MRKWLATKENGAQRGGRFAARLGQEVLRDSRRSCCWIDREVSPDQETGKGCEEVPVAIFSVFASFFEACELLF